MVSWNLNMKLPNGWKYKSRRPGNMAIPVLEVKETMDIPQVQGWRDQGESTQGLDGEDLQKLKKKG